MGQGDNLLIAATLAIVPAERLRVIQENADDDRILKCAVASRSQAIVSYDHDLRRLGRFRDMPILLPPDFLAPDFLAAREAGTACPCPARPDTQTPRVV